MAEIDDSKKGPGKLLIAARKKAGLSQSAVGEQLNLSVETIKQLETDHYKGDIPDAFIRGYLRTYARAVEQDEEEVIALYSQAIGSSAVHNHFVLSEDISPVGSNVAGHSLWFKLLGFVVVVIIIIIGWLAFTQPTADNTINKATVTQAKDSNVLKIQAVEPSTEQQPEVLPVEKKSITVEAEIESETVEAVIESETVEESQPETVVLEETVKLPSGFVESPVLTDAELEFNFLDDCWVQVIDSNDEVMAVGLKAAGRRFLVRGVPPIQIVLGKPRSVSIQFNNEAVDLSIYPASQTARFSIGEEVLDD